MRQTSYVFDPDRKNRMNLTPLAYGKSIIPDDATGQIWLNFKGSFNLEMLYKLMYEWLTVKGYGDLDIRKGAPGDGDKFEHYYFESAGPDGMKGELWYWWRLLKPNPDKNKYFNYRIHIDVQVLGLKDDVITVDGNKFGINTGEISIFFRAYLDMDHKKNKEWKEDFFLKRITKLWEKRWYLSQIDQREDTLYNDLQGLYAVVKQYLGLNNFTSTLTPFHPNLGVPQYKL